MKTLRNSALALAALLALAASSEANSRHGGHNRHRQGYGHMHGRYSATVQHSNRHAQSVVTIKDGRGSACSTVSIRPGFQINLALKF